jgi:chorismate mutase
MTEPVMYFGIGFLVATLGLLIVLRVHHRTLRLDSIDQFHADVRQLEEQLAIALGERSELQREIAAMKRDAELTWVAERIESALFRERINDVAYEVMRIGQRMSVRIHQTSRRLPVQP